MRLVRVVTRTRSPAAVALADLADQVVHLALGRADLHLRIDQPRRADDLLHHLRRVLQLVGAGRGGGVDHLVQRGFPFLELQRAVVQRAGQPEAVVDEHLFARPVAVVHAVDLRDRHVRLVHDQQPIGGEVVEQRPRPRTGLAQRQRPAVVLDAGAIAHLAHHLHVVARALLQPLRLQQLALLAEELELLLHLFVDELRAPRSACPAA